MPKATIDPVIRVLTYFETAELGAAQQALALVQHTLRKRRGGLPAPAKKGPAKGLKAPVAGVQPLADPAGQV